MQKFILLFTLIFIGLCFKPNAKKFVPPGTKKYNDTLFVDETEISNISYLEYLFDVYKTHGIKSETYTSALPDTTVWRQSQSYNEPYVTYYLRHVAYRNYPVVGISYKQALAFCKWRTQKVKEALTKANKFTNVNFEYRLPTKTEWEGFGVAKGNSKQPFNLNKCYIKPIDTKSNVEKYTDVVIPVNTGKANVYKLQNTIGNVAEMLFEEGVCKGGSWLSPNNNVGVTETESYTKPTSWLGFRCVCVIKR